MTADDLPRVSELGVRSKASWGYDAQAMEVFSEELTHDEALLERSLVAQVALRDGEIVGYFTLVQHSLGEIELDYMFVAQESFGTGVGREMMEAAMSHARELGAEKLTLIADPNAQGFYQKFGAVVTGSHQSSIKGREIPIMEIRL